MTLMAHLTQWPANAASGHRLIELVQPAGMGQQPAGGTAWPTLVTRHTERTASALARVRPRSGEGAEKGEGCEAAGGLGVHRDRPGSESPADNGVVELVHAD